ncbi:MAG: hypothetical protein LPK02_08155 [Rhodobacterales bacterium]|nr:hypothetical protein [Rhodobacterales bacterium]MDX5413004.1 hypothetical protein [Rhodobacterales bacterium]
MTRMFLLILQPVILWALHFIAVYALISAACGPRALLDPAMLKVITALVTLIPAVLLLIGLIAAGRRRRRIDAATPEATLAAAAYWSAAIALLAVIVNVTPVAVLSSCTG